jgi:uncharacterized protein (TIGR02246 family)
MQSHRADEFFPTRRYIPVFRRPAVHPIGEIMHTTSDIETEPLAALHEMYAAWEANDADALAALYTADATVVRPGSFTNGREEVRAFMATAFAGPMKGSRAIDRLDSVRLFGEDTAIVISVTGVLLAGETDLPADRYRRGTWTLVRDGGQWLIAAMHNCETA